MIDEFIDLIYVCLYCGEINEPPNEQMAALFGMTSGPRCCEFKMAKAERNNLYDMIKGVEKLKANLENEILKGAL